jgi:MFS family permease
MRSGNASKPKIVWKEFLLAFIVAFNSLTWITLTYAMFNSSISNLHVSTIETLVLFAAYYAGVAGSSILGSIICPRARKISFLLWILAGAVVSTLLTTITTNSTSVNILISLFLGISVGFGLPSCLAYFADVTFVENRGIHGGITWSAVGFGTLLLALFISALNSVLAFLALAVWRGLGLIAFFFTRSKGKIQSTRNPSAYSSILRRRTVILYLVPWVMFCLVNFVEAPMLENLFGEFFILVGFIEFAISGLFAFVGGILADLVGRKRIIIIGFVVLGIEYAVLSLLSEMPVSWYIYTAFDGIAWGMFASVFLMTLWGDLAGKYEKEKYYLVGGLPYILASFLSVLVKPYVGIIPLGTAFSLASFFLFLAVIPLMYAPETLPEKKIRERELKGYVEKAKKIKEKYN